MGGGRPVGWPPFHFALVVEDEVGAAEGAIVACRLVSHRNMRRDLAIDEPLQQPDRTISAVACEPRLQAWPGLDGATISPGGAFAGYVVVRPRKDVGQSVLV
jgi:hypothetical protein